MLYHRQEHKPHLLNTALSTYTLGNFHLLDCYAMIDIIIIIKFINFFKHSYNDNLTITHKTINLKKKNLSPW